MSVKKHSLGEEPPKKKLWIAYVLWAIGGLFGLHHLYLGRDRHAFVLWSTVGGCGFAWMADFFSLPSYVREANGDPVSVIEHVKKLHSYNKPQFSVTRFTCSILVGYWWSYVYWSAIPVDLFLGVNWKFLYWFTPIPVTLGVWTVGNIGQQWGDPKLPFLTAVTIAPIRFWLSDDNWITVMLFWTALVFDIYSKEWHKRPPKKQTVCRRMTTLTFCGILYLSLWVSFFYFNGTVTDSNGDEIPVQEAMYHFFTSPWWVDLQQSLHETYMFAQHHGWYQIWLQIVDLSDPRGEQNAYKILGVSRDASQQEITSVWRKLSREFHPDKEKDPALREATQQHFLEIQQAYNILSNTRSRRNRKNKRDNEDFT